MENMFKTATRMAQPKKRNLGGGFHIFGNLPKEQEVRANMLLAVKIKHKDMGLKRICQDAINSLTSSFEKMTLRKPVVNCEEARRLSFLQPGLFRSVEKAAINEYGQIILPT